MKEGKTVEALHSPPLSNDTNSKEILLCNVNFQEEHSNGSAVPCNGVSKLSPPRNSEQVSKVNRDDEHIITSMPSEQVNGAAMAMVPSLQQDGGAGIVASMQEESLHLDDKEKAYRQGNWVFKEILILLEAKLLEQAMYGGISKRHSASADDKWKQVADYCKSKGVHRTKEQCRIKWDNMMPDFRKIRDYEELKETGAQSYFEMATWERRVKHLPSNMDADVYQRIANILSNKPSKGGLKKEAREKRLSDPSPTLSSSLLAIRGGSPNGAEGSNGADFEGDRLRVSEFVGKHIAASAPRKRRRRKMVETALPKIIAKPETKIELLKPHDDSSTEDDMTVMSARSQQGAPVIAHLYAERSSLPSQYSDRSMLPLHQRLRFEDREALPASFLSLQNGHDHAVALAERGNSTSPMEGIEEKGPSLHESTNGIRSHDMVNQIEDRKDARHKELMALEREKLAVFREATITIANAMTSAVAMFSKVAEELLLRHR